ncbi:hypothetical protein MBANPS3_007102 [Mucor bainieri]
MDRRRAYLERNRASINMQRAAHRILRDSLHQGDDVEAMVNQARHHVQVLMAAFQTE